MVRLVQLVQSEYQVVEVQQLLSQMVEAGSVGTNIKE